MLYLVSAILGVFSFAIVLAYHNTADGDLWGRLAQGAYVFQHGHVCAQDFFAFTPVLPDWVDHEWGTGVVLFAFLKYLGPDSLMLLKILLAMLALGFAFLAARTAGNRWPTILLLALPGAMNLLPGYVPVLRAHAFSYVLAGLVLYCLEQVRQGRRAAGLAVPLLMIAWTNLHGGFVAGLGLVGIYLFAALLTRQGVAAMGSVFLGSLLATLVNPYGMTLWHYLLPALLHPRPYINEWKPVPWGWFDVYIHFRILFVLFWACVLVSGFRAKVRRPLHEYLVLAVTSYLALTQRRHIPFFAVAVMVFGGVHLEPVLGWLGQKIRRWVAPERAGVAVLLTLYAACLVYAAGFLLKHASLQVLAPVGLYPVREVDVLMYANARGNLLCPLAWGNYCMWRLYPNVKISLCGRYETVYPDSTYELTHDFLTRNGRNWNRIVKQFPVDFIVLPAAGRTISHEDLLALGYDLVWDSGPSVLYARKEQVEALRTTAARMPPRTIQPLDATIPNAWWSAHVP